MKRLLVIAAAALALGGMAATPAVADRGAGRGNDGVKERGPSLDLRADIIRLGDLATFECTATVEDAEAVDVVVEACQAFRNGAVVAEAAGDRRSGNTASSERWTGELSGSGDVVVCVSALARLTTGTVLGHYACED